MRAHLSAALIAVSAAMPPAGQRGVVTGVRIASETVEVGASVTLTATGTNPCGAVNLNYGDGNTITYPISQLPADIKYVFAKPGTYQVVARGMGNCDGETSSSVRVLEARSAPPAPAPPAPGAIKPADRGPNLDRNRDGVVSRDEWTGDDQSFRAHDWNRDGILSGDEVREAERDDMARRVAEDRASRNRQAAEDVDKRFTALDRNRDDRISRDEWDGSRDEFEALDRNSDWVLTKSEIAAAAPSRSSEEPGVVVIRADKPWTDTGLDVRLGDRLTFEVTGSIRLSADQADTADRRGSQAGRHAPNAPVPQALAGALIGRVGDSVAFDVGVRTTPVRAPRDGRLYLGINDDYTGDNQGAFRVRVTIQAGAR